MAKKKEEWITGKEAIAILRKNSGREDIRESYLRLLAVNGKITTQPIDGRTNEYLKSDVESYIVKRRDQGKGKGKKAAENNKKEPAIA